MKMPDYLAYLLAAMLTVSVICTCCMIILGLKHFASLL